MTLEGYPFDSSPIQTEDDWYDLIKAIISTGVVDGKLNEFEVTAGTGLAVDVDTGHAIVEGFFLKDEATDTVSLSAADASNDRIDVIVLEVNFAADTYQLTAVEGTPAASPSAPSLTQTSSKYQMALANVTVQAAANSISAGDISDQRSIIYVGGGSGVEPEEYWGGNLTRNYPSLELANGAQPEWWEVTNDPTLTEEDATGESIPQKHERVLKLVVSADGGGADYAYMDFDAADEPTLDDNVTKVSAGCWVYTGDAGTVTLELYDVDGSASLGTDTTATTGSWVWLEVLDKTYQDSMRWRVTHSANNATVYIAMPSLNVGATVLPWKPRRSRRVMIDPATALSENPANTNWADLDLSSYVSSLTNKVFMSIQITGSGDKYGYVRPNGSSWAFSADAASGNGTAHERRYGSSLTDDAQIVEEKVENSAITVWIIRVLGYEEWS